MWAISQSDTIHNINDLAPIEKSPTKKQRKQRDEPNGAWKSKWPEAPEHVN